MAGRHAAGKHRRPASNAVTASSGVRREKAPKVRLSSGGAPFAVAGVAVVAVAAAGGLTSVSDTQGASASSTFGAQQSMAPMQAIPLDRQLAGLRTDTTVLAQRASRAQERASLALRLKQAEQARKRLEALRPKFVLPLREFRLTAGFGESSRLWSNNHTGLDFAAPTGTTIRAVADGVIVSTEWAGAYGWRTIIEHEDGTQTWYCHQSGFIRRSGKVKAGTPIGRVGSTGNTTGSHLHLEVRVNNDPINPKPWLIDHGLNL